MKILKINQGSPKLGFSLLAFFHNSRGTRIVPLNSREGKENHWQSNLIHKLPSPQINLMGLPIFCQPLHSTWVLWPCELDLTGPTYTLTSGNCAVPSFSPPPVKKDQKDCLAVPEGEMTGLPMHLWPLTCEQSSYLHDWVKQQPGFLEIAAVFMYELSLETLGR